ncbi:MAG TPA: hypothetical protein VHR66_06195, partial [Gemmataceae bacterium]|nr:hypothetical protein [Gemmataceae bacterium]
RRHYRAADAAPLANHFASNTRRRQLRQSTSQVSNRNRHGPIIADEVEVDLGSIYRDAKARRTIGDAEKLAQ